MSAERYVLSLGGGVNSVALMILLVQDRRPFDEAVFADTGVEVPETYAYLKIAREYLERNGVPLTILKKTGRTGDLYKTSWRRRVFPSAIWRWSTRDFKVNPIHRHYRSFGVHVNQYMGIAYDEIERMKHSRADFVTNFYPLVEQKITREGCAEVIRAAGLPVPVKSGCYFCPFNSFGRWRWLHEEHPDLYAKAVALEEHSKHFPSQRLTDQVFRERAQVTLRQLGTMFEDADALERMPLSDLEVPCGAECMT